VNSSEVLEMFSVPIFKVNLTNYEGIQASEAEKLKSIEFTQSNKQSPFLSVDDNVLEDASLARVKKLMDSYIQQYTSKVLGIDEQFTMFASWVTKNVKGTQHHPHTHENVMLSCLLYFNENLSDNDMAPITLINELGTNNIFRNFRFLLDIKTSNKFNSSFSLTPKNNTLVIFPGWIMHQTTKQKNDTPRYCIASNYFIEGLIGRNKKSKYHQLLLTTGNKNKKTNVINYE
jgi:hypothetical protein